MSDIFSLIPEVNRKKLYDVSPGERMLPIITDEMTESICVCTHVASHVDPKTADGALYVYKNSPLAKMRT